LDAGIRQNNNAHANSCPTALANRLDEVDIFANVQMAVPNDQHHAAILLRLNRVCGDSAHSFERCFTGVVLQVIMLNGLSGNLQSGVCVPSKQLPRLPLLAIHNAGVGLYKTSDCVLMLVTIYP